MTLAMCDVSSCMRINALLQTLEDFGVLNNMPHTCTITSRNAWTSCLPPKMDKTLFRCPAADLCSENSESDVWKRPSTCYEQAMVSEVLLSAPEE